MCIKTNVKGNYLLAKYFTPLANPGAAFSFISSDVIAVPTPLLAGMSSYKASKLALNTLVEYVAAENPDIQVLSYHPGVIATDMMAKATSGKGVDAAMFAPDSGMSHYYSSLPLGTG